MPTIQKPEPKQKALPNKDTDMARLRRDAYNNTTWRKLRNTYIREHPLCEECLKKGKVTPAHDVHHKKSPFSNRVSVNTELLLDYNNLEAVCSSCHQDLHNRKKPKATDFISALDALMETIPD